MQQSSAAWLRRAREAAQWVGVVLFGALFAVFIIQISARFVFNRPLPWTDELAVILYTWVVLWGCTTLVDWRAHVAFDAVVDALPKLASRLAQALQATALIGLFVWAIPACWDYVRFMHRESTPVLGWSYAFVFAPFVLMMASVVVRCWVNLMQSLRHST